MAVKQRVNYRIRVFLVIMGIMLPAAVYAGGASQSAASNRGRYLTDLGYIYQPEEIQIDSLLSKEDYNYPLPRDRALNVTVDTDIKQDTGFIQIGLKGKKDSFEAMAPMNICFVIDISGSMADRDKLSWVKNAFYIFINRVRPEDMVSVVVFDNIAEVLIPPTKIKDKRDRDQFKQNVDILKPRGGTDILKGMLLGYTQVEQNYRSNYTNRVLLLTDGMHNGSGTKDDIITIVKQYNPKGITISTIALGAAADINLMTDMAVNGGGSSRFISDHDQMEETFGSELDRLVVSAARMISMEIILSEGIQFQETWGYKNWVQGNTIHYALDTLHNGDYETIFAIVKVDAMPKGEIKLGTFSISYEETNGAKHQKELYDIVIPGDRMRDMNTITNRRVKQGEGFVVYGKGLISIGEAANAIVALQRDYQASPTGALKERLIGNLQNVINQTNAVSAYLRDINNVLETDKYHDELTTLENYEQSFAALYENYAAQKPRAGSADQAAQPVQSQPVQGGALENALNLAAKTIMDSVNKQDNIAIVTVSSSDKDMSVFVAEELEVVLVKNKFIVVDRSSLDKIKQEQNFQLSGEVDDASAVSIGKFAGAKVVIVGSITGSGSTRRLRLRALNTQTAHVIGAASEAF